MSGNDGGNQKSKSSLADLLRQKAVPPDPSRQGFGAVMHDSSGQGLGALPPPPRGLINSLVDRPEVNSLYYNGKTVTLDGYTFIGCRFDNCTLHLSTSNFNLIRCIIDPSTTIVYGGSALKIIQLFNSRYPWAYEHLKEFVPTVNSDGTITISTIPDRAV